MVVGEDVGGRETWPLEYTFPCGLCARTRLDVSEEAGEFPDERANGGVSGCLFACEVCG